ncbi:hypothetical protein EsH8_II_000001 [Colletotrichum jinshuiense]
MASLSRPVSAGGAARAPLSQRAIFPSDSTCFRCCYKIASSNLAEKVECVYDENALRQTTRCTHCTHHGSQCLPVPERFRAITDEFLTDYADFCAAEAGEDIKRRFKVAQIHWRKLMPNTRACEKEARDEKDAAASLLRQRELPNAGEPAGQVGELREELQALHHTVKEANETNTAILAKLKKMNGYLAGNVPPVLVVQQSAPAMTEARSRLSTASAASSRESSVASLPAPRPTKRARRLAPEDLITVPFDNAVLKNEGDAETSEEE